jgi:hypothetical protein
MTPVKYRINLTGESPLLMHADDLQWRAKLDRWLTNPENKRLSKAGDDRTPAWKWLGYVYHDAHRFGLPADNLMTMLREGGAKVPTGKRGATFKRQSQSGLIVDQLMWPIMTAAAIEVPWAPFTALEEEKDYELHEAAAVEHGFELFAKGVTVGRAKHIRVRPRFDVWTTSGTMTVVDETITEEILRLILEMAGTYCGLGDWRPSSPSKPGPWGRFRSDVKVLAD